MTIEIKSTPKHSPSTSDANIQMMRFNDVKTAREWIKERQSYHRKNSKWFEIWIDGKLEFDSAYIHHSPIVKK
jgi:hypothetical protein